MSERRRRRKKTSEESDESDPDDENIVKEERKESASEHEESEYESAEDEEQVLKSDCDNLEDVDGGGEDLFPGLERQQGDGEENPNSTTNLDDDEDKKNPQYIPKRGMFYEHDDRIDPEDETQEEEKVEIKKKPWKSDTADKWGHDKFAEIEQTPKSKDELVAIYGYDIRNEDCAPRARRRRRYGRGPNKYTRNWEDEEAYVKPAAPKNRTANVKLGSNPLKPENADDDQKDVIIKDKEKPEDYHLVDDTNKIQENEMDNAEIFKEESYNTENNKGNITRDYQNETAYMKGHGKGDDEDDGVHSGKKYSVSHTRDRSSNSRGRWGPNDKWRGIKDGKFRENMEDTKLNSFSRLVKEGGTFADARVSGRTHCRGRGRGLEIKQTEGIPGSGPYRKIPKQVSDQTMTAQSEDLDYESSNGNLKSKAKDGESPCEGLNDRSHSRGAKRYSNQRRGGGSDSATFTQVTQLPYQETYSDGLNSTIVGYSQGSSQQPGATFHPLQPTASATRLPMNTSQSGSGVSAVGPPYINSTSALLNYGPPGAHATVQYPVPVKGTGLASVTVPMSLVGPSVQDPSLPLTAIPNLQGTVSPGVGGPLLAAGFATSTVVANTADQVLLAAAAQAQAAAGGAGTDSFTEVRGGVTYFNPTAQNVLPQRPMSKRPKAAIPIVDPSQMQNANLESDSSSTASSASKTNEPPLTNKDKNSIENVTEENWKPQVQENFDNEKKLPENPCKESRQVKDQELISEQ